MSKLTGRTALVSGGASGIGRAIVHRLVRDGAQVIAADVQDQALHALQAELGVRIEHLDVTSETDVRRVVDACATSSGPIDVLVNAAGVMTVDDAEDIRDEVWERLLDVNLTGAMRLCRAALPQLRRSGRGAIVNLASVAAFNASAGMASYASGKAGLVALTRAIANRYGRDGVRANCICPGWVRTPMSEAEMADLARDNGTSVEAEFERLTQRIALGRVAEPEEIAACVAFLASHDASFVTGAVLVADGGARTAATSRAH